MVVHEHVGVHGDLRLRGLVAQRLQEGGAVFVVQHHRLAVVAALQDVVKTAGKAEAGQACHARIMF